MSESVAEWVKSHANVASITTLVVVGIILLAVTIVYRFSLTAQADSTNGAVGVRKESSLSSVTITGELGQKPVVITSNDPNVSVSVNGETISTTSQNEDATSRTTSRVSGSGTQRTAQTRTTNTDGNSSIGISVTSENSNSGNGMSSSSSSVSIDSSSDVEVEMIRE